LEAIKVKMGRGEEEKEEEGSKEEGCGD